MKYKKSLWPKINRITEEEHDKYSEKEKEITSRYKEQFVKDAEEYADKFLKSTGSKALSYKDVAKYASKHYNHEHGEWYDDDAVSNLIDNLFDSNKFTYDWDKGVFTKK